MISDGKCAFALTTMVLILVVAANSQILPQNRDPNKTYQVTGTVVNSATGRPIPRVLVSLNNARSAVLTGPQGDFSFDDVPPGPAQIEVRKPGYFPTEPQSPIDSPVGASLSYTLDVGPDMEKPVLKLAPGGLISGAIMGNDEEPLEGAEVNVLAMQLIDGRRQLRAVYHGALSDEDGNFRIADLPPGRYYLSVKAGRLSASILGARAENGGETYPPLVYYPASSDLSRATQLDVAAGQHQEVKFALKMVPSFRVAGVIAGSGAWKEIYFPGLVSESQEPLFIANRFDRQSGTFEFRAVPAGNYWMQLEVGDGQGHFARSYRRLLVQSDQTNLRISVDPGVDIPVLVQTDFAKPVNRGSCTSNSQGQVHVSDCSDWPAVRLQLRSLEFSNIVVDSDSGPLQGPLSIRGVSPGKYSVKATPMFGGYVQSMRFGSVDLLSEPLVVSENGSLGAIEVVLRDDTAMLKIQVPAEKPRQQILVLVYPDPITTIEPTVRTVFQSGDLHIGQLAPGSYKIFAFAPGQEFDSSSIEALNKYATQATSVKVGSNENASVAVKLIHIGE